MITHIFGLPKKGKTALLTYFAVINMFGELAEESLLKCHERTKQLNKGGFRLTVPEKHLVYADYNVTAYRNGYLPRCNHITSGYRIGIGEDIPFEVDYFPPYSTILLAEAQSYWDCHLKSINPYTMRFLQFHGHRKLNIFVDSQRFDGLYKDIRQLTERYIEVLGMKVIYKRGKPKTVWTVKEYSGINAVESCKNNIANDAATKTIVFEGDIWRCYNAFDRDSDFMAGHYNEDYTRGLKYSFEDTISAISARNLERSFVAPCGYYDAPNTRR